VAEASHDVAFVLDQVTITAWPNVTELGEAEMVAVGWGEEELELPQPCKRSALAEIASIPATEKRK